MRILVMGAGALGGYIGAPLQAAGHALSCVARGAHLAERRARALRIESTAGDLVLARIAATDDPAEAPSPDVVLLDDLNPGQRIELNYLSGEIDRLGREYGVSTPVHAFVTATLQPYVDGPPDRG